MLLPPLDSHTVHFRRRNGRKIVPEGVVVSHLVLGIRFIQSLAVAVDDAVQQVDRVTVNAYDARHGEETGNREESTKTAVRFDRRPCRCAHVFCAPKSAS